MTTSGVYSFDPGFSNVVLSAYARCGLKRPSLTAEHFADAGNEGNYLLSEWASKQPLLWKSELISVSLTTGTATYALAKRVVMILLAYIESGSGTSTTDRVIGPLSTTEYASLPAKLVQGQPTSYWFNRLITPEVTFWTVPDQSYTAKLRCVSQVQDVSAPNGATLDIPYRAIDAFVAGLAHRLARIHAPTLEAVRKQDAMEAWATFANNDVENTPLYLAPQMGGYYR